MEDSNTSLKEASTIKKTEESSSNIFIVNEEIEQEIKEKCGIPNWGEIIFGLFNFNLRKKLIETSQKNEGYYYFVLGITKEYGIDTAIDYQQALKYYEKAALLKESFSLYKLYNIYCYQSEKYQVNRNREKEIFYLFQSIAFSDASFFMNNDTFFKIDIFYEINLICDLEDNLMEKLNNLFKNCSYLEENKDDLIYIESIITLKFLTEKHNIDFPKQLETVERLKKLAENEHLESCYKLAVVFRQSKIYKLFN